MDEKKKQNGPGLDVIGGVIAAAVIVGQLYFRGGLFSGVSNKLAAIFWGLVETAIIAVFGLVICGFLGSMFAKLFENFDEAPVGSKVFKIVLLIVCVVVFGEMVGMLF